MIGFDWNSTLTGTPAIVSFNDSFATYHQNQTAYRVSLQTKGEYCFDTTMSALLTLSSDNKHAVEKNKYFEFYGSCNEFIASIDSVVTNENGTHLIFSVLLFDSPLVVGTSLVPVQWIAPYWASAGVVFAVEAVWPWEVVQRPAIETLIEEVSCWEAEH